MLNLPREGDLIQELVNLEDLRDLGLDIASISQKPKSCVTTYVTKLPSIENVFRLAERAEKVAIFETKIK